MRFLITRPQPDADQLAEQFSQLGHETLLSPIMNLTCANVAMPDPRELCAMIITSRNALRCLERSNDLSGFTDLPLFAVGKSSANAARRRGFTQVYQAQDRAKTLAPLIKQHLQAATCAPLYYPGGKKKAFDLTPVLQKLGFEIVEQTVYEMTKTPKLTPAAIKALKTSTLDGVVLLSPRSGRLFVDLVQANKLDHHFNTMTCLCLSQNVAMAVEHLPWRQKLVSPHPDMDKLLGLIKLMD